MINGKVYLRSVRPCKTLPWVDSINYNDHRPRLVPRFHITRQRGLAACRLCCLQLIPCRFALRRQQSTRDFGGEAGCWVVEASLRTVACFATKSLKTTAHDFSQVCGECMMCVCVWLHLQQQLTHCSTWTYLKFKNPCWQSRLPWLRWTECSEPDSCIEKYW